MRLCRQNELSLSLFFRGGLAGAVKPTRFFLGELNAHGSCIKTMNLPLPNSGVAVGGVETKDRKQ